LQYSRSFKNNLKPFDEPAPPEEAGLMEDWREGERGEEAESTSTEIVTEI